MLDGAAAKSWESWLGEKLGSLEIDAEVYGAYITGILVRIARVDAPLSQSSLISVFFVLYFSGYFRASAVVGGLAENTHRHWTWSGRRCKNCTIHTNHRYAVKTPIIRRLHVACNTSRLPVPCAGGRFFARRGARRECGAAPPPRGSFDGI